MTSAASSESPGAAIGGVNYPSIAAAWGMVGVLTLVYVISFIDRYIIGYLVEPIKATFSLSDTEIGLLLGPAFAIFYALMGLPLGWLADRKRRTWIIACGLLLWSLATTLSGLARSFLHLFLARMSVAIGEAALSPCAMSMIADSFPKERRATPIAVYNTALSLGPGLAALASAVLISWTTAISPVELGDIKLEPWQLTLIIVGLPGVILAPILFFMAEPVRRPDTPKLSQAGASYSDVARHIGGHWKPFAAFISVFIILITVSASFTWAPATFERSWGWSPQEYGFASSFLFIIVGPATIYCSGRLSDRWFGRGMRDAPMVVALLGIPLLVAGGIAWPLMPNGFWGLAGLTIMLIGSALTSATGVTALLNIVPSDIRGQTVALYFMTTGFVGLGLGPLLVGLMSDFIFGEENLRFSVALLPFAMGVPLILAMPMIRRLYRSEYDRLNQAEDAQAG